MAEFDLDADRERRRAEAEAKGDETAPHTLVFGGEKFNLPRKLPMDFSLHMDWAQKGVPGAAADAMQALFGDQLMSFLAHKPDEEDFYEIVRTFYGDPGESQASGGSSKTTGGRSRPTSKPGTASTSRKRAGAKSG